jgi:hypothetical protein
MKRKLSNFFNKRKNSNWIVSAHIIFKTNKTKEVDKLTSNLLVKAKSIFYTEIP